MVRGIPWVAVCGLGLACGDRPDDSIDLREHCGATEPVMILALGPAEYPSRNPLHAMRRVGDRLVYLIETYADGAEFPATSAEDVVATDVYATGPCGEDPLHIGEDIDFLFDPRHAFGDAVLGCRRTADEVVVLDPTGAQSSRVLMDDVGCAILPVADGVVGVVPDQPGAETGRLMYRDSLTDPDAALQVLHESALVPFVDTGFYFADIRRMRTTRDEVLVLTPAGEIVAFDVGNGSQQTEVDDAAGFELSYDGRFILWQPGPPVVSGGVWDEREMYLLDRETGEQLALGVARFGIGTGGVQTGMVRASPGLLEEDSKVVLLPSMQLLTFPPDEFVNGRHPESGFVMWSPSAEDGTPGPLHVLDPDTGESMSVFDRYGGWTTEGDQFLLLEETGEDEYTLWERYLDEAEQTRVVDRVFQPFFVSERRVAGVRELDGTRLGSLYVLDRDSGAERVLGAQVNAFSSRLNWNGALAPAFAFAVHDDEASGIYVARVD